MHHMAKQNYVLKSHLCAAGEMTTIKTVGLAIMHSKTFVINFTTIFIIV